MISNKVRNVFRKYLRRLYKETPTIEIINELVAEKILSSYDANRLRKIDVESERNFELMEILQKRRDKDIIQFCKILQDCQVQTIQELGKELEMELMKVMEAVDSNSGEASSSVNEDRIGADADSNKSDNNSEMDTEFFDIIAEKLDIGDLLRLGNLLRLSATEIDEIKLREHSRYDKVYKVLKSWENKAGQNADISVVVAALRKMEKTSIANQLEEKIAERKRSI
ncbi:hypothetical protein TrispH2_011725 [Trichoplax sp. H2]|nr:hypothetical protein TrispH2_011725 [Trichoplax sp. H2]|eukprot:RDD36436.1 hypothetical protein TrispH2_011725 [Trichoplax sp. H2]